MADNILAIYLSGVALNGSAVNESIYDALSWKGLQDTDPYKNAVKDGVLFEDQLINIYNEELSKGKCN